MSQQTIGEQIIAKAMKDEAFRQALLSNPKAAIERALGISLPFKTILVYQDTPTTLHLVLPSRAVGEELSEAELEQVTGGVKNSISNIR